MPTTMLVVFLVWAAVWGWLMWRAWGVFAGAEGVWLALLGHGVLLAYLAGVMGTFVGLGIFLRLVLSAFRQNLAVMEGVGYVMGGAVVLLVAIAVMWVARRGERFIAGRCIKRYLLRVPAHD